MGGALGGLGGGSGGSSLDLQMHKMPIVGNFFTNPDEQYKQQEFQRASEAYGAYRPEAAQYHMNALANRSGAYQSANNLLGRMSGGQGGYQPQGYMNPMGPGQLSVGQPRTLSQYGAQSGPQSAAGLMGMMPGGFGGGGSPFGGMQGGL